MTPTPEISIPSSDIELSVVIPLYGEALMLPHLFARLYPVLDGMGLPFEIIFVDDGSRDNSPQLLREQFQKRPKETRVLLLATNCGQHNAIRAGFEKCKGRRIITLDADLQNPPEDIPLILKKMDEGFDCVGGVRQGRRDQFWRRISSRFINHSRELLTNIKMTDQGCMLRGYDRLIIEAINDCREINTFIPALAYTFARRPTEVFVSHAERQAGRSRYSFFSLMRLYFDLMTGFSVMPLRIISLLGIFLAFVGLVLYSVVIISRSMKLGFYEGLRTIFDRDILQFFLIGILLFSQGLFGEYLVRIYQQVINRPMYRIAAFLEDNGSK